jgi:hypothetical protein
VIEDVRTRRHSLINVFTGISFQKFPVQVPRIAVYALLTNGNGTVQFEVRCSKAEIDRPLLSTKGPITFPDPNATVEMIFRLDNFPFPEPGTYSFAILWEDEPLSEYRLEIQSMPPRTPPEEVPR